MPSLDRVLMRGTAAEPLPVVWQSLASKGIKLRAGQVAMLAGEPNAGKSLVALAAAAQMRIPTLYLSADTDKWTMFLRGAAAITGDTQEAIEDAVRDGNGGYYIDQVAELLDHIRFQFDPSPSVEDINLEVGAFTEMWGRPPELLVLDNLMNVQGANGDEWAGLRETMQALHEFAHTLNMCILVLHHTSEGVQYDVCPPRRSIHGKVSQLPELILTIAKKSGDTLAIAAVKNRNGKSDASGNDAVYLRMHPERVLIQDAA